MAVLNNEAEGPAVIELIEEAVAAGDGVLLPFLVVMEVEYLLMRRHRPADAERSLNLVLGWPAEVVESFEEWRREAARVKAAGDISVVDAWVAALGLLTGGEVLHKDPQFEAVVGLRQHNLQAEGRNAR